MEAPVTTFREILIAAFACSALAGCGATAPQQARSEVAGVRCASLSDAQRQVSTLLAAQNVQRVEPTYHEVFHRSGPQRMYVSGARIYVPGEPGLNEAYLARALSCHAASPAGAAANASDPLRVDGVRSIAVQAFGQGFAISVTGVDRAAGAEIWQRADALSRAPRVEQLSSVLRSTTL
jgi:hypothetical protein